VVALYFNQVVNTLNKLEMETQALNHPKIYLPWGNYEERCNLKTLHIKYRQDIKIPLHLPREPKLMKGRLLINRMLA
jgi:hypothetical protein